MSLEAQLTTDEAEHRATKGRPVESGAVHACDHERHRSDHDAHLLGSIGQPSETATRMAATGEQGNKGTGEQGNRRTGEQGNRGTGEQGNRGTGDTLISFHDAFCIVATMRWFGLRTFPAHMPHRHAYTRVLNMRMDVSWLAAWVEQRAICLPCLKRRHTMGPPKSLDTWVRHYAPNQH